MAFTINTNVASLQAQNYLRASSDLQGKTINRVTSGLRIVTSGDDAAGLAIANSYRSDQSVLTQGIRNANDGLSQLQIADGGINNISQLLDRARTLATQSASGAFTGDRSVLNSEFQSVITEIDRQAQAVGLNQGGTFARSLNIFIGGGKASNGVSAGTNGSVGIDLSQSTVDSTSLGLKGVQASGVSGTDIGSGSASTSLSTILTNATNTGSVATPGFTKFVLKGPGFDGNGVAVNVNTANLGGTSDLVTAVNTAITNAANGGTQSATALKNANITAAVSTDANGKQQLVFKSATTAFQVEAGDRLSNALLGNFEQNAVATSTDTAAYVDTHTNNTLDIAINGASADTITLTQAYGTSKGQLVKDLNTDSTFNAKAVAYLDGNKLVIKSKTNSSSSAVAVTGTLATALGFGAASSAAAASTGADLNVRVQGAAAVNANANVIGTDSNATKTITAASTDTLILTVGSSGAQTLTLTAGTTLTKADIAADINAKITANGNFTGNNTVTAKVVNNQIVLETGKPGTTLTLGAGTANTPLGFTSSTSYTAHTATTSDNITLRFQGGGLTSPVDISLAATTAGTTTTADVLTDLQTKIGNSAELAGAGITLSSASASGNLVFTSAKGEQFQVLATGDSTNVLGLGSFIKGANSAVDYTTITAASSYSTSAASGTATFGVSLNGGAASGNTFSANLAGGDATAATQTGTVVYAAGVVDLSAGVGTLKLSLRVDGGSILQTASLGTSATTTISSILSSINTALGSAGTATLNGSGNLVLTSASKGANSSIEIVAAGAGTGSDANVLTKLGLTGSNVTNGANASIGNVVQQLNDSIATDSDLVKAGLSASSSGGKVVISSSNGTYFRLSAYGAGNTGFNNVGASFAGNTVGAAPTTSPYFNSQGADASATLAYTDTLYGSDDQNINVTASDATGTKHSLSISLQNDATARNQSIDQALTTINTKLQQSNDSTLNRIVAVKDESGGTQSIKFLSTVRGFQVTVGGSTNGTGITPPSGNTSTATTVGTGATADINTESAANAAVSALADAVGTLGKAQAVVGRGQNQFNYAVNLAQSQVTNLAAAESRIRDADLAQESANLTKSQILLQAGIAALAQANSAPQQVLSLLRG
jgi:flagellin